MKKQKQLLQFSVFLHFFFDPYPEEICVHFDSSSKQAGHRDTKREIPFKKIVVVAWCIVEKLPLNQYLRQKQYII
jgi:hypothetical protein